eukprot:gene17763-24131_t
MSAQALVCRPAMPVPADTSCCILQLPQILQVFCPAFGPGDPEMPWPLLTNFLPGIAFALNPNNVLPRLRLENQQMPVPG